MSATAYVEAMRPLIEVLVKIAPDLLAAEGSRDAPDIWAVEVEDSLDGPALADGIVKRLEEDEANEEALAELLEQLGREAGVPTVALARAAGLLGETIALVDVKLRRRLDEGEAS